MSDAEPPEVGVKFGCDALRKLRIADRFARGTAGSSGHEQSRPSGHCDTVLTASLFRRCRMARPIWVRSPIGSKESEWVVP